MSNTIATELVARDADLQAACKRSETTLNTLAKTAESTGRVVDNELSTKLSVKTGKTITKMSASLEGLSYKLMMVSPAAASMGASIGAAGETIGGLASMVSLATRGTSMLTGLLGGPLGMAIAAAGVGMAAYTVWTAKSADATKKLTEEQQKLKDVADKAAPSLQKLATIQGNRVIKFDVDKDDPETKLQKIQAALRTVSDIMAGTKDKSAMNGDYMYALSIRNQLIAKERDAKDSVAGDQYNRGQKGIWDEIEAQQKLAEQVGVTERQKKRAALEAAGADDQQLRHFDEAASATEAAEARQRGAEAYEQRARAIDEETAALQGNAAAAFSAKLAQQGLTDAQVADLEAREKRRQTAGRDKEAGEYIRNLKNQTLALEQNAAAAQHAEAAQRGFSNAQIKTIDDLVARQEKLRKSKEETDKLKSFAEGVKQQTRTPEEVLADEQRQLDQAKAKGFLDDETFARGSKAAKDRMDKAGGGGFRSSIEDARGLYNRIQTAAASTGDDPNKKTAQHTEKTAKNTERMVALLEKNVGQQQQKWGP